MQREKASGVNKTQRSRSKYSFNIINKQMRLLRVPIVVFQSCTAVPTIWSHPKQQASKFPYASHHRQ